MRPCDVCAALPTLRISVRQINSASNLPRKFMIPFEFSIPKTLLKNRRYTKRLNA
jgi:hypothetical protein